MSSRALILLLLLGGCTSRGPESAPPAAAPPAKDQAREFVLLDHEGNAHNLFWHGDAAAVVIVGLEGGCAAFAGQAAELRKLKEKFAKKGVVFYFVNPSQKEGRDEISAEMSRHGLGIPVLLDTSQVVTRDLGLSRVGEAVVISPQGWKTVYHGGLPGLAPALTDLTEKRPVAKASEPVPPGACEIPLLKFDGLDYARHIAPVLKNRCLRCHSKDGGYPPFLENHHALAGWASMIRETIVAERMPPYSADPYYGNYLNAFTLLPAEKAWLAAWIDAGAPRGEGADPLERVRKQKRPPLPPKIWEGGMKAPEKIGPTGTLEYIFFEVAGPAPYDMWVTATNVMSSNPRQLHHSSFLVLPKPWAYYKEELDKMRDKKYVSEHPDGDIPLWSQQLMSRIKAEKDSPFIRFGAWAAGRMQPHRMQEGVAYFIPKGSYLVLEVHYVGNGKDDQEQSTFEFYGYTNETKPAGLKKLNPQQALNLDFEIPAGSRNFSVTTKPFLAQKDMLIKGMLAHLHIRGRAAKLMIEGLDGKTRTVMSIPNYDYNWHTGFAFRPEDDIPVKKGEKVLAECRYDNSAMNPRNPDATKAIRHGQTFDRSEMCQFMFSYVFKD